MNKILNIFLITILMIAACACHKESVVQLTDHEIVFMAVEAGDTKALLDETTFATQGNQLHIYDHYRATDNTTSFSFHIDDYAESRGSVTWPFVNQRYSWTADGIHRFYGWLHKDVNMPSNQQTAESFFGSDPQLDKSTQKLTLPSKTIAQNTPQFDFMYSNIYERNLNTSPDFMNPVELEFSHLFTSFGVAVKNESKNITYRLCSVKIDGLVTSCQATIDFSGAKTAAVSYNSPSNANGNTADYSYTFNTPLTLPKDLNDLKDVLNNGNSAEQNREYKIAWPMTAEQAGQVKITVVYDTDIGSSQSTKTLTLSEDAWEAGKKNNINIVFIDKEVHLICTVQDWTYEEEEMQFTDVVTIHEDGKIRWEENSYNSLNVETGEIVIKNNGEPAIANFHIETPFGAVWHASLISTGDGHVDAFEFVPVEGSTAANYGIVGEHATIQIRARNLSELAPTHKAILRITVTTGDGRTMVVNELAPSNASYREYTIVQNMK